MYFYILFLYYFLMLLQIFYPFIYVYFCLAVNEWSWLSSVSIAASSAEALVTRGKFPSGFLQNKPPDIGQGKRKTF